MHRLLDTRVRRPGARRAVPALAAAAVLALTACQSASSQEQGAEESSQEGDSQEGEESTPSSPHVSLIATVKGDEIDVHTEAGGEEVLETLASPNDFGADRVFLVEQVEDEWLEVLLPIRPNGSTGWVRRDEVSLASTTLRVEVEMEEFEFAVYDGEEELLHGEIGLGREETPTPAGTYYFTELLQPEEPDGDYGAYAFGLSGFSPTLEEFAGGPGQLAVHGTNDEDTLGGEVSHGCIRVSNDDITWMAENLPLGTPVEVSE